MGMPQDEYWNGDSYLTVAYRRADKIKQESKNIDSWWDGVYIRQAVHSALSCSLPWFKKGIDYPKTPYKISPPTKEEQEENRKKEIEKAVRSLTAWKDAWDRQHG